MRVIPLSKQRDSDIPEYKRKFSGRWSANIIVKKLPAATCTIWKRSKKIVRRSTASECVNWVATLCICVIGYIYTCLVYHLSPKKVNVCQNLSKIFRSQMSFTAQTLERVFVIKTALNGSHFSQRSWYLVHTFVSVFCVIHQNNSWHDHKLSASFVVGMQHSWLRNRDFPVRTHL